MHRLALIVSLCVVAPACATRNMDKRAYFQYLEDRDSARAEAAEADRLKQPEWRREDALLDREDARQDRADQGAGAASSPP